MNGIGHLLSLPLFCLSFFFFLLPGILLSRTLRLERILLAHERLPVALGLSAFPAYVAAGAYLTHPLAGKIFVIAFGAFMFALLFSSAIRIYLKSFLNSKEVWLPLFLLLTLGCSAMALVYAREFNFINDRFDFGGSPDYLIQRILATRLQDGLPIWNISVDNGLTMIADRPPLLAGAYLLQKFWAFGRMIDRQLYVLSAMLQFCWIPVTWSVFRTLGLSLRVSFTSIVFMGLAGTFFYFEIFPWPKLWAGSLVLTSLLVALWSARWGKRSESRTTWIVSGLFLGLGILAHSGVLYTLPLFFFYCLGSKSRFTPRLKAVFVSLVVAIALCAPWITARRINEPHAPSLVRYALVGADNTAIYLDKSLSTWEAVAKTYKSKSVGDIFSEKWQSFLGFFVFPYALTNLNNDLKRANSLPAKWKVTQNSLIDLDGEHLFRSFGILGVAFLIELLRMLFGGRPHGETEFKRRIGIFGAATAAFALWLLAIRASYVTSHTSLALGLAVYIAMAPSIAKLRGNALAAALGVQWLYFWLTWGSVSPTEGGQVYYLLYFIAFALSLVPLLAVRIIPEESCAPLLIKTRLG